MSALVGSHALAHGGGLRGAAAFSLLALTSLGRSDAMPLADIMGTKVWLDQHLFNSTLKTVSIDSNIKGQKAFMMSEEKARDNGIPWPVNWPTLCFIGLGEASVDYFVTLATLFPELQLALMEVEDMSWVLKAAEMLGEDGRSRLQLSELEDFAEDRGAERRVCQAISWSVDSPPFSFYRYRELFYSSPYILALFNLQGCTMDTRLLGSVDKSYYCEYLYHSFQSTLCGKINEKKMAPYQGQELYFPMVEAGCGEDVCMCHAHSDAFYDFHFEHMCKKNQPHRFMGQWGQDEFLVRNVFWSDFRKDKRLYVDIGASHPYHLSNSAYFDNCLGWRGICFEPNPRSKFILKALRTCNVVSACAWANETTVRFANGAELAAMTDDDSLLPSDPLSATFGVDASQTYFEARCAPLHKLLVESLAEVLTPEEVNLLASTGQKPRIDLISLDAEGAEIEIFRGFPFEAWDIRCIVVETSRRTAMAIDGLLLPQGFVKIAVLGKDAVYVSREAMAVLPARLRLPQKINWNEPGSDSDTIEYMRFQRLFGAEGDLDVDVGDQRLLNETEIARQWARTEAANDESLKEIMKLASESAIGGMLSDKQKETMEREDMQAILRDAEVKAALNILSTDHDRFMQELQGSERLRDKIKELVVAGVVRHAIIEKFLGVSPETLQSR
ncbi:unnamed protein product [Polarella glacialis]|uniref:Methyltransferase FkbM domain-containing protein n=1 Tax=Polarella glacialis TaxID=89957 RepID=A0A813EG85_POLGL|nr:unnamed protein product [Polarella glacialis]